MTYFLFGVKCRVTYVLRQFYVKKKTSIPFWAYNLLLTARNY